MENIIDDEKNEVVSRLAFFCGAAVIVVSLASLAVTLVAVLAHLLG